MSRILQALAVIVLVIGLCMVLYPLFWWWQHPDMTQMQMWREWWILYVAGGGSGGGGWVWITCDTITVKR